MTTDDDVNRKGTTGHVRARVGTDAEMLEWLRAHAPFELHEDDVTVRDYNGIAIWQGTPASAEIDHALVRLMNRTAEGRP